jgi:DNA-damage-inducible protein J
MGHIVAHHEGEMAKKAKERGQASRGSKAGAVEAVRRVPAKTAQVRARTDPRIKKEAEKILDELGLNPSTAINMFYSQIVLRRGLPFPVEVPNAATREAMEEARSGAKLIRGKDLHDLLAKLLSRKERSVDLRDLVESDAEVLEAILEQ